MVTKTKRMCFLLAAMCALLSAVLSGCAEKEVPLAEYKSKDESVSIMLDEGWQTEDAGLLDGWLSIGSPDGQEAFMLMQFAKGFMDISFNDVDGFKAFVESNTQMDDFVSIENPSLSGLTNLQTYQCTISMNGFSGSSYLAYGESDYAYYAVFYMPKKLDDKSLEKFKTICASFRETAPEPVNTSTVEVTDTIRWFNASCAILTQMNGWNYNILGGLPLNDDSKMVALAALENSWGITDRASADDMLDSLQTEGTRASYMEDMEYLAQAGLSDIAAEDRAAGIAESFDITAEEAEAYVSQYEAFEKNGENAISAWDYSRAMSLIGDYYLAGLYTETEALDASPALAASIQKAFDSWDSYTESYLLGYEYATGDYSGVRLAAYEELKAAANNPFTVDWNTTLEKSW